MPRIIDHNEKPVVTPYFDGSSGQDTPTILSGVSVPDPSGADISWASDPYAPIPEGVGQNKGEHMGTFSQTGEVVREDFDLDRVEELVNGFDTAQLVSLVRIVRHQNRLAITADGSPAWNETEMDVIGQFDALTPLASDDEDADADDVDTPPSEDGVEVESTEAATDDGTEFEVL